MARLCSSCFPTSLRARVADSSVAAVIRILTADSSSLVERYMEVALDWSLTFFNTAVKYDFVTKVERASGTMTLSENKEDGAGVGVGVGVGAAVGEMMCPAQLYN